MSGEQRLGGLRELGESAVSTVLDRVGRGVSKVQERRPLAFDLLESDEAYLVVFDTPGVTNADLQVQFREGAVEVRVDRFRDFFEGFEMVFPGRGLSLDGRAELPADAAVDPETAEATLTERGTLEVRVPKADDAVAVSEGDDETDPIDVEPDDGHAEAAHDEHAAHDETDADRSADAHDETDDDHAADAHDETDDDHSADAHDETDDESGHDDHTDDE